MIRKCSKCDTVQEEIEFNKNSSENIKLFDPYISESSIEAVSEVLRSGWIGLGAVTEKFEQEFAKYVGSKYAVAVNSATAALHLAVKTLNLKPGDEVITTPMTFVSTNHVLLYENLVPVFCDIEEDTLNLDLKKAQSLITDKTKAIMVVHYAGNPLNMDALQHFALSNKLKVIQDAAHACGASYKDQKIGSFGLTAFSFHAVKNLPAGDGGIITINDEDVYERLRTLRWLGINKSTFERNVGDSYSWDYGVKEIGFKYHMNDITASIALANLNHLDLFNLRRQEIVDRYRKNLLDVCCLKTTSNSVSANHLFVIKSRSRDALYKTLSLAGISAGVHYKPNHLYSMYKKFVKDPLPVTEKIYKEILSLPLHLKLSDIDVDRICRIVNYHCFFNG